MENVIEILNQSLEAITRLNVGVVDIVEVLILAVLIYNIMIWIQKTRAWVLLKGLLFIAGFLLIAALFDMTTIMWIAENFLSIAITALIIVIQPELRKALEDIGKNNIIGKFQIYESTSGVGLFSDNTLTSIVEACRIMADDKTGALVVIENHQSLDEYKESGIAIDAIVSSQLLVNIFEHNTPLHDGAVIIVQNKIAAATCYLPLSDNRNLSKELGTRHRAALGTSENTDALVIAVSEETGAISVAFGGVLKRNIGAARLQEQLVQFQSKQILEENQKKKIKIKWLGGKRNET